MNSPTERQQPENEPLSPREMIEQAMSASIMEVIQLRRTLWLVLQQAGGVMKINEADCHPLWRMKATRLGEGQVQLESVMLPIPTAEELDGLAEILNGSMAELVEAMQRTPLRDHPPMYIEKILSPRVVRVNGEWVDAKFAKGSQEPTGNN